MFTYDTHTGSYKIINTENKQFSVATVYIISILCNGHKVDHFRVLFYYELPVMQQEYILFQQKSP